MKQFAYAHRAVGTAFAVMIQLILSPIIQSQTLEWTRQFGSSEDEGGTNVSADRLGNIYLSGDTKGSLAGPFAGNVDKFFAKG